MTTFAPGTQFKGFIESDRISTLRCIYDAAARFDTPDRGGFVIINETARVRGGWTLTFSLWAHEDGEPVEYDASFLQEFLDEVVAARGELPFDTRPAYFCETVKPVEDFDKKFSK